jgi:hypothetical protein
LKGKIKGSSDDDRPENRPFQGIEVEHLEQKKDQQEGGEYKT